MTTDDTNEITPEKVRELLDNLNSCFTDPAINQEEAVKEFHKHVEYTKAFAFASRNIARAFIDKCARVETMRKLNDDLAKENKRLQGIIDRCEECEKAEDQTRRFGDAFQKATDRLGEEVLRLQGIIDRQRDALNNSAVSINNSINMMKASCDLPESVKEQLIDSLKGDLQITQAALALTGKEGEWIKWDGNEKRITAEKPYPVPSQTIVEVKYRNPSARPDFTKSKAENFAWYYSRGIKKFEEKDDQIIAYRIIEQQQERG